MGKITIYGLKDHIDFLDKLSTETEAIFGKAIYDGAEIIADRVRENINALPAVNDLEGLKAWKEKAPAPLTIKAKMGLQDGLGIATMQRTGGTMDVKIGFDGYNSLKTKKYPNGQPNALIARSIESGSSIAEKHPFIRPALNATRKSAQKKMADVVDQEIKKLEK